MEKGSFQGCWGGREDENGDEEEKDENAREDEDEDGEDGEEVGGGGGSNLKSLSQHLFGSANTPSLKTTWYPSSLACPARHASGPSAMSNREHADDEME